MQGWVATKLLEDAVANVNDPTTSQAILNDLWSVATTTSAVRPTPLRFVKGQNAPKQFCSWLVQIVHGKYTSADDATKLCGTF